jgi:putative oxidoreductase
MPATTEPKLLFPGLQSFYDRMIPLSWVIVRLAAGGVLAWHGWGKVVRGLEAQAGVLAKTMPSSQGWGVELAAFLIFVELLGGVCIMLGLFTRFFASAAAIQMGYLTFVIYLGSGFSWLNRGYEYTLLWGLVLFAIALRGGGPYSLDRAIGREL